MGVTASRNQISSDQTPSSTAHYRYPPEDDDRYFSSHYYLGHRKFESGEPELFLFGDLPDLNYLPPKPATFPYKQPPKSQPVSCLRSFINLQRESIKLSRTGSEAASYNLEFTFDSDVDCTFTIIQALPDTVGLADLNKELRFSDEEIGVSPSFHYGSGSDQNFQESDYTVTPSKINEDYLTYDSENDKNRFPLVILMQTNCDHSDIRQAQMTICNVEPVNSSNSYTIKVLKQKLLVDSVEYLLQEVYGLENKSRELEGGDDDSDIEEDLGAECVICITDTRDTILLPCRHLCLCSGCAANLRYQSSNCPICRAPFRALLQIQALEPLDPDTVLDDDEATGNPKYSVPGYQCVPLLQALNGYDLEESEEDTGPTAQRVDHDDEEDEGSSQPAPQRVEEVGDSTHKVEDVCVVPIEDEAQETDGVSSLPAQTPTRTTPLRKSSASKVYEVREECLPGTPITDHVTVSLDEESLHCGSSASSEISVKSSDMLLPGSK